MEDRIKEFLIRNDHGVGYGLGAGMGTTDGDGEGDGLACGSDSFNEGYDTDYYAGSWAGNGDGTGGRPGNRNDDGKEDGNGYDIIKWQGKKVYFIDGIPTLIDSIHKSFAKGHILYSDFTIKPCYIAKVDGCFAHVKTLHGAFETARSKALQKKSVDERIAKFKEQYPNNNIKIPAAELYEWHNVLTGSCSMGRQFFAEENNIDINNDSFTVNEFIELTKDAYGGEIIQKLKKQYE